MIKNLLVKLVNRGIDILGYNISNTPEVDQKLNKAVQLLFNDYGFKNSVLNNLLVDKNNNPIPWYTYSAIEYLKQLDFSKKRIFEFGSGNSTLFWSKLSKSVTTVEHNEKWYLSQLRCKCKNMKLTFIRNQKDYAKSILNEKGGFDVVVIDSIKRYECCQVAIKKLRANGFIILDNTDRRGTYKDYRKAINFLKSSGLVQIDFCGLGPIKNYSWCASIFITRDFNFRSKTNYQPINIIGTMYKHKKIVI